MNLRERTLHVLNKQKPDMVPWLGDLDYWYTYLNATGKIQEKYKGNGIFQMHRDLGVGFYLQGYFPYKCIYEGIKVSEKTIGNSRIVTVKTPVGTVREIWRYMPDSFAWAPEEHFVKDTGDLKVIRYWYEHTFYEANYQLAQDRYERIGDNGIVLCYLPKSPLMEMVALLAGIEASTYALSDDPDEFDETMSTLEDRADEAARIALDSPAECLMIPENLSSEVIGKHLHQKYMHPYETKWNERIKAKGKYSFVHLDGTMKGLISEVSATGFTVLEALTPSPVGDIAIEDLHEWVNADSVIWGGIPGVYFTDLINDQEFDRFVIHVLEVMRTQPRYVLGVADQVPPCSRWERIQRVGQLVEKFGRY